MAEKVKTLDEIAALFPGDGVDQDVIQECVRKMIAGFGEDPQIGRACSVRLSESPECMMNSLQVIALTQLLW
jgi:hypothetical protein